MLCSGLGALPKKKEYSNIESSQMDDHTRKQQHLFYEQWDCSASDEYLNVQRKPLSPIEQPLSVVLCSHVTMPEV